MSALEQWRKLPPKMRKAVYGWLSTRFDKWGKGPRGGDILVPDTEMMEACADARYVLRNAHLAAELATSARILHAAFVIAGRFNRPMLKQLNKMAQLAEKMLGPSTARKFSRKRQLNRQRRRR